MIKPCFYNSGSNLAAYSALIYLALGLRIRAQYRESGPKAPHFNRATVTTLRVLKKA